MLTKLESFISTKNRAVYSHIILFFEKRIFTCIMAICDKKDSVSTCKISFTRVCQYKHWNNEKAQVVTPDLWHACVLFSVGMSGKPREVAKVVKHN